MAESSEHSVQTDANPEYKHSFHWDLDFSLNIGEHNRRFFDELEEQRIMGNVCPDCGDIFVPPRAVCPTCLAEPDEWVELEQEAVLESYTVCFFDFRNMPEPPYITGVVRIGDASTPILHFIDGIDYDEPHDLIGKIEKGDRLEPVWSDERTGDIQDISHFTPLE